VDRGIINLAGLLIVRSFHERPIMAKKKFYESTMYDGMIKQNNTSFANMPTEVVFKQYPASSGFLPENLNDGMSGIDGQMGLDNAKKRGSLKPKKV